MPTFVTNLQIYLSIAEDAATESERVAAAARRPKPDGQPGEVITFDPEHRSFKQSLIAIAFSGMYLEALLKLEGKRRLDKSRVHRFKGTYEDRLKILGVNDPELLARCKRFRDARNELTHEDAIDLDSPGVGSVWMTGQVEAANAVEVIRLVTSLLR